MGANTEISWCDHTFNAWVGCTKVSAACDFCYAETWAKRSGHPELWRGTVRRTTPENWKQPIKWNAKAARDGVRYRVFCASLSDVFDNQAPPQWRGDLWGLIHETPNLDWLLLTKRPQNIRHMLPVDWDNFTNVWLGTTVENQTEADRRIPHLLAVPAKVHFLSCEPLLGPVDVSLWTFLGYPRIGWVICGGESGGKARPMHPDWARSLRDQCAAAGVAFHFKQWGEWVTEIQSPEDIVLPGESRGPWATYHMGTDEWGGDLTQVFKVGKKAAGRLLDGVEHNGFPA
jgi:protein gp37